MHVIFPNADNIHTDENTGTVGVGFGLETPALHITTIYTYQCILSNMPAQCTSRNCGQYLVCVMREEMLDRDITQRTEEQGIAEIHAVCTILHDINTFMHHTDSLSHSLTILSILEALKILKCSYRMCWLQSHRRHRIETSRLILCILIWNKQTTFKIFNTVRRIWREV